MKTRLLVCFVILLASRFSLAELTSQEKTEWKDLETGSDKIRLAIRSTTGAVSSGTTDQSRQSLYESLRELHEINRDASRALAHFGGTCTDRNPAESQSCADGGRTYAVQKGRDYLNAAIANVPVARAALQTAQSFNVTNSTYQNALSSALTYLNQAETNLLAVDQSLGFMDPYPATEVTAQNRTIGPHGDFEEVLNEHWNAGGHYGHDFIANLIEAYPLDSLLPSYSDFEAAIDQGTLMQDRQIEAMKRWIRIEGTEPGESADPDWRTRLLRSIRQSTKLTSVPTNFHNIQLQFLDLMNQFAGRPNFETKVRAAMGDMSDAWRHSDEAVWQTMLIPETGIL